MSEAISDLTNMSGQAAIDRTADFLEVSDTTGPTSYKATPNFILGITGGDPVSTTDTQTLTNKTVSGSDNTITNIDPTNVTGLPAVAAIVTLTDTQTLTNKTLTSPTINTATIADPTLTVDAISEFTSANGVVIDGVTLKDGGATLSGNLDVTGDTSMTGSLTSRSGTATPAAASAVSALTFGSAGLTITWGTGAPSQSQPKGSLYIRTDGSSGTTRLYINTNGSTTWTPVTTSA